jgi:hypothetical protein
MKVMAAEDMIAGTMTGIMIIATTVVTTGMKTMDISIVAVGTKAAGIRKM